MFGFVPCFNYIGSCGYKSCSRKEKSTGKKRSRRDKNSRDVQRDFGIYSPKSVCTSVSSLDVSDISLDRPVLFTPSPLLKLNMQLYSSQLSKIKLLCNIVCKNIFKSAKNVQRPVILPRRGGQAFLFH